mmetsp:Transcript_106354/g.296815  ORF Transcript_106354/g.296815 Transcript_106354/m.296815 type:complete len:80 (+) Transcript_106354:2-241(+)
MRKKRREEEEEEEEFMRSSQHLNRRWATLREGCQTCSRSRRRPCHGAPFAVDHSTGLVGRLHRWQGSAGSEPNGTFFLE